MPRIQHIAILAKDQAKLAEFYKATFGMTEVWRHASSEGDGQAIYLSDGHINVAILPARNRPEGIDHFGIQVDDRDATAQVAVDAGGSQGPKAVPQDGRFAEVFIKDPVGTRVDLSERGWKLTADEPQRASVS
jgi:catechol 2,3-dioxygenase-like lactoylglutathione lyase family enzyme